MVGEPNLSAYADLDSALAEAAAASWSRYWGPIADQLVAACEVGDWEEAHRVVDEIDLAGPVGRVSFRAETHGLAAAMLGAENVSADAAPEPSDALDRALAQWRAALTGNAGAYLRKVGHALVERIRRAELEKIAKAYNPDPQPYRLPDGRSYDLQTALDGVRVRMDLGGRGFFALASSLHLNRLRSYGFLQEAQSSGVTRYRINAELDERTCGFCQRMHGREFAVRDGALHVDRVLAADPSAVAAVAPWPAQDEMALLSYDRMTAAELATRGLATPPYHPFCRCVLTLVEQTAGEHPVDQYGGAIAAGMAAALAGEAVATGGPGPVEAGTSPLGGGEVPTRADGTPLTQAEQADAVATARAGGLIPGFLTGLALSAVLFGQYTQEELDAAVPPDEDAGDLPEDYDWLAYDPESDDGLSDEVWKDEDFEAKHPREPSGTSVGGEFTVSQGGGDNLGGLIGGAGGHLDESPEAVAARGERNRIEAQVAAVPVYPGWENLTGRDPEHVALFEAAVARVEPSMREALTYAAERGWRMPSKVYVVPTTTGQVSAVTYTLHSASPVSWVTVRYPASGREEEGGALKLYDEESVQAWIDLGRRPDKRGNAWGAERDFRDVLVHELVHVEHRARVGQTYPGWKTIQKDMPRIRAEIRKTIGEYATKDPLEFVAEAYVHMTHGLVLPDRLARLYKGLNGPEYRP